MNNYNDFAYFTELAAEETPYEIPEEVEFESEDEFQFEDEFEFMNEPQLVEKELTAEQFLYEIDCRLSQYFYPIEEPDQGYFIREKLLDEFKNAPIVRKIESAIIKRRFREQITEELIAEAMHPHRMMARMQMFEDIEEFFECC